MKIKDLFIEDTLKINWDYIESLDVFKAMVGCPHSKIWHKEGDPWQHTKMVTRIMEHMFDFNACIKGDDKWSNEEYRQLMIASALCHDLGKPSTTFYDESDNDYHCAYHGAASETIVRELFKEEDALKLESLAWLVRYHMDYHSIMLKSNPNKVLVKLENKITEAGIGKYVNLYSMRDLNWADSLGSINDENVFKRLYRIEGLLAKYHYDKEKENSDNIVDTPDISPYIL